MKLLFDQNLSPRLITRLSDVYPGSCHLSLVGLDRASDLAVWEYALHYGFVLVTRDADFSELSAIRGFPPKVVWVRRGNCSTSDIELLLRSQAEQVNSLGSEPTIAILELY